MAGTVTATATATARLISARRFILAHTWTLIHNLVGRRKAVLGWDRDGDGLLLAGIVGVVAQFADVGGVGSEEEAVTATGEPGLVIPGIQGDVREPRGEVDPSGSSVAVGQPHATLGLDQRNLMRQHSLICRRHVEPAVEAGGQDDVLRFSNLAEG